MRSVKGWERERETYREERGRERQRDREKERIIYKEREERICGKRILGSHFFSPSTILFSSRQIPRKFPINIHAHPINLCRNPHTLIYTQTHTQLRATTNTHTYTNEHMQTHINMKLQIQTNK